MALIAMAVYSTAENGKDECLLKTIKSLIDTVDFNKHRIVFSVNGYTDQTKQIIHDTLVRENFHVFYNGQNLGTAEAINKAWALREEGESCIKMDDDVVIHQSGWVDLMEEAIARDPEIGICGLKRKDCWEKPEREDFYKSELYMLPQQPGQKWIVAEKVNHVMGTCQMYSSALLDKIGYLYQPRLYGFDDSLAAIRCKLAGFKSVFLPQVEIDHIDKGQTGYQSWKEKHAGEQWAEYNETIRQYQSGEKSIYYNPFN